MSAPGLAGFSIGGRTDEPLHPCLQLPKPTGHVRNSLCCVGGYVSEWKTIDTAPTDGTEILVCVRSSLPGGEYQTHIWIDSLTSKRPWPEFWSRVDLPFIPTHWMPLPEPPR